MDKTFNMGVGMAAIVAPDTADATLRLLKSRGVPAWPLGEITNGKGQAMLS
jgi:phosphoribosylformylglycinamidine cyclo-ligase